MIILQDDDSILRARRRSGRFFLFRQLWFCLESTPSSRFYMIYTVLINRDHQIDNQNNSERTTKECHCYDMTRTTLFYYQCHN
ncbi:unnamed protein product [Brugia pahangi]|uniref:Uncharacterized protein n=1 Tax=Brugia pahangi TaxID=6280 RepID=A0A0N4TXQ6_BRUPA|nr:unnamed protein product [Brugia pahangi]